MLDKPTRLEYLLLLLLSVVYAVPVVMCWNQGYLDFGDGNYMYISWRLSQGAVLYRDILAPQPPLHLYLGAAIAWLGDRLLPHPLWAFRTFSLLLHLGTMVLVWKTARALFRGPAVEGVLKGAPLVAAAVYLLQPIGFWWTLGYQSQPLLIFLLLIMFYCVVNGAPRLVYLGGFCAGLALLTNMTTAPYVAFTVGWMLLRRFRWGVIFMVCVVLPPLLVIPAMEMYTGNYISNVFQNQAGAFPRAEVLAQSGETLWGYFSRKLMTEGGDVLRLQGTWVVLATIGMLAYSARRRRWSNDAAEYTVFYAFFSLCCIIYVTKGGTVDYVFSVAEPYVALFAAPVLVVVYRLTLGAWGRGPRFGDLTPVAAVLIVGMGFLGSSWPGLRFVYQTLRQDTYELPEMETLRIVGLIKQRTRPSDLIIAPPHFAFLAQRQILADYSEHFLWRIKYMNERLDGEEGPAVKTVEFMGEELSQKKLPFLVMDMNQTGTLPEISRALESHYQPLLAEPLQMLNTPLQFYEPRK